MTNRERFNAILHYQPVDRIPVVCFGYWTNTPKLWANQGYISHDIADGYAEYGDNSPADRELSAILGFDFNRGNFLPAGNSLYPPFEREVLEVLPDGSRLIRDEIGLIVKEKPGVISIPSEVGTTMTGRDVWEEMYLPRLQDMPERINMEKFRAKYIPENERDIPRGITTGSLYGYIRNILGVEELAYLAVDDEDLYREIIDTFGKLAVKVARRVLQTGATADYAHIWEDICFKNGPLVNPEVFRECVGPHYKALTTMLKDEFGIDIVMVDCDGWIDKLVPIWLENGVNTMFPIEVGTWGGCIAGWRSLYGKQVRGIGGVDKRVFAKDKAAVDREIERIRPLTELGGYVPCIDHMIPPDAQFPLVAYYCEQFRKVFQ